MSKRRSDIVTLKGVDVKKMTSENRKRFTFRIPSDLFELLQEKAKRTGVSTNALILQILWDWEKSTNPADAGDRESNVKHV